MFKILTFIVVGYLVYRWFIAPKSIPESIHMDTDHKDQTNDDDYVDYEEIED